MFSVNVVAFGGKKVIILLELCEEAAQGLPAACAACRAFWAGGEGTATSALPGTTVATTSDDWSREDEDMLWDEEQGW